MARVKSNIVNASLSGLLPAYVLRQYSDLYDHRALGRVFSALGKTFSYSLVASIETSDVVLKERTPS